MSITFLSPTGLSQISLDHVADADWVNTRNSDFSTINNWFGTVTFTAGGILFGNASAKIDKDASNLFWDNTNKTLMVGANTTSAKKFFAKRGTNADSSGQPSGNWLSILYNATNVSGENGLLVKNNWAASDSTIFEAGNDLVGGAYTSQFKITGNGEVYMPGGIAIGNPTGGNKGAGTINVATNIFKNNTAYTNPDYVLEHWVTGQIKKYAGRPGAEDYPGLLPLAEVERFVRDHWHLPRISRKAAGIFDMADIALEKIEELFLHLIAHEHRLETLEARA